MSRRSPARIIAGCFALCGFSTAVLASLGAAVSIETVLLRAVMALVACFVVGAVIGAVGERCIREGFGTYQHAHPVPTVPSHPGAQSPATTQAFSTQQTPAPDMSGVKS